jgi:hypothetical protein
LSGSTRELWIANSEILSAPATLALEAYYKANIFDVRIFCFRLPLSYSPPLFGKFIKRMTIYVGGPDIEDTGYAKGWRYFLTTKQPLDSATSTMWGTRDEFPVKTNWQAYFPNLQELEITIGLLDKERWQQWIPEEGLPGCLNRGFLPQRRTLLTDCLEKTSINLKATRMETKVWNWRGDEIQASCECMKSLQGLITRMATK